jgi:hypothetical protein
MHPTETLTIDHKTSFQIKHNTKHETRNLVDGDPTQAGIFLVIGSRNNDGALSHR